MLNSFQSVEKIIYIPVILVFSEPQNNKSFRLKLFRTFKKKKVLNLQMSSS